MSINLQIVEVKKLLIEVANLPEKTIEMIDPDASLFDEGLGLDSIDILELVVSLEKRYGIKIKNDDEGKNLLKSVRSIATELANRQANLIL